jgi:hypothetical protein
MVTGEATYVSGQPIDISFRAGDWSPQGPEQGAPAMGLRLDSIVPVSPRSEEGRSLLRSYFDDIVSRYRGVRRTRSANWSGA